MKAIKHIITNVLLISLLAAIGCGSGGGDAQPDPVAEQIALLINDGKAWQATTELSVIKDGFDVSNQFAGFKVTFSEGTFRTENALSSAWPSEGNWQLDQNDVNTILRGDGVAMLTQHTGNTLTLTFTAGGPSGGRTNSVAGEFQFVLISQ